MRSLAEERVTHDDVAAAARRLDGVAHRTPVFTSRLLDARTGGSVFLKAESLQRSGAFKFRGAFNAVASLAAAQRRRGVAAFSSGNHAQAVALAAALHDAPAVILMPQDAPAGKVAATRGYGAEVVTYDRYREDREQLGRALAEQRGLALIPPFDHPHVIAGQGTATLELLEEVPELELVVAPVGGGGLLSGAALAATAGGRPVGIVGVEPAAGDDVRQSLAAGQRIEIPVPRTIADGLQTTRVGALPFAILRGAGVDVVTVEDGELIEAMRFLFERLKLVVEPSGAAGVAALLSSRIDTAGARTGVILSGGNVDADRFAAVVAGAGR